MGKGMIHRIGESILTVGASCMLVGFWGFLFGFPILLLGAPISASELQRGPHFMMAVNQICSWSWLPIGACAALGPLLMGLGFLFTAFGGEGE